MRLTLTAPASIEATDTEARELRGVALPYGIRGFTSAGPVTVDAGAIHIPDNLRAVKLFRDHGRQTPIGYALEADDTADALRMAFRVGSTPDGDLALLEASEGLRDALSVELNNVTLKNGHVTAADLVAVAQVAVPAFAGAELAAALSDEDEATVAEHAQAIVDLTTPPDQADDTTATQEESDMPSPDVEAAAQPGLTAAMLPPSPSARVTRDPDAIRRLAAAQIAEAMRGATDVGQINAALTDITPTSAATEDLFPRPAWIGELWSPEAPQRAIVNAIGVSPLTGMKMQGWKWVTKPQVAPYAGNKAEIPTSPAQVGPAEAEAQRIAGGWDLDRIYVDFNTGFVQAFLQAATQDYRKKSQTYFIDGHAAVVGPPAVPAAAGFLDDATDLGGQGDVIGAVNAVVAFLLGNGANVSFLAMGSDAYTDFLGLTGDAAPWWLQRQGTLNLGSGVNIDGLTIATDPGLDPATVVGGDRNAVSLWETGPINVQAVNVPNGGIDLALFGYWAQQVHDPAGLATATTAAPVLAAKKTTSSSSS
jgi:hypothetical protein